MFGTADPYAQDPVVYGPASLRVVWDTTYNPAAHPSNQTLLDAVIHLDNDHAINLTGLAECPPASLAATTTAAAIAACPASLLGTNGVVTMTGGAGGSFTVGGVVTAFRGQPISGEPVIILHVRVGDPVNVTMVMLGRVRPSMVGGDFGTEIAFLGVPDSSATGLVITHMDFRINNLEAIPTATYFTSRCFDPDHYWNYRGIFAFRNGGGLQLASEVQQCNNNTITTAAPLVFKPKTKKKCKKKPRKRCKKKR